ncbi:MAG TPA: YhbY family RNA-binding protein [Gemmatimonadaceae bacterium]|jgi:RNA-binding protein|nr:YhbY family RNA-binding protein [Gemmatimonadaceae bacterium]
MPLTSKQRAALRAEAHHLSATVHLGHQGATPTLIQSADDALRARELVKVQLNRSADARPREVANALAAKLDAEVVQVIGRTATLYRANPDLPGKVGDLPPWRR